MPPAPLRALTSLAAALAAACALAQAPSSPPPADPPPTPLPAEYSDAARKAYVAGLKEARELIAQKRYEAARARARNGRVMRGSEGGCVEGIS